MDKGVRRKKLQAKRRTIKVKKEVKFVDIATDTSVGEPSPNVSPKVNVTPAAVSSSASVAISSPIDAAKITPKSKAAARARGNAKSAAASSSKGVAKLSPAAAVNAAKAVKAAKAKSKFAVKAAAKAAARAADKAAAKAAAKAALTVENTATTAPAPPINPSVLGIKKQNTKVPPLFQKAFSPKTLAFDYDPKRLQRNIDEIEKIAKNAEKKIEKQLNEIKARYSTIRMYYEKITKK